MVLSNLAAPSTRHRTQVVTLSVPTDFRLPDLEDLGGASAVATPPGELLLITRFWDSHDLRLLRWGCTLSHRADAGWTLQLPAVAGVCPGEGRRHFEGGAAAPPQSALDVVAAYLRGAPVEAVAELQIRRRAVALVGADGQLLAEIGDDQVANAVHLGNEIALRQLEVTAATGSHLDLLDSLLERLCAAGAVRARAGSGLEHALPQGTVGTREVIEEPVSRSSTTEAVVRRCIASSVLRVMQHDVWVRAAADPEAVHQARVAIRRLRSDLRTFAPLFDAGWVSMLRGELRWIGRELGAVRDAQVLMDRLCAVAKRLPDVDRPEAHRLIADLVEEVATARQRLLGALRSPRYLDLLDRLVAASREPRFSAATDASGRAVLPARAVLPGLVSKPWAKLRKAARKLDQRSTDEQLHALRIRAKRCRYAAEAAATVVGRRATRFAGRVAALQDVLGEHQDAVVAAAWLHGDPSTGAHRFTAGQLWGLERAAAASSRGAWPAVWRSARRRRKLSSWMNAA